MVAVFIYIMANTAVMGEPGSFAPGHDIVVIGASADGVDTLTELVGKLAPDLPASILW